MIKSLYVHVPFCSHICYYCDFAKQRYSEKVAEEYLERLMDADPERKPIRKDRYCLANGNQYFEIDIYPFWQDQAILEIELTDPDEEIRFQEFISLIREVTDDEAYQNASLAKI